MKLFCGKTYSFFLLKEFIKAFLVSIIFIMGLSFIVRTLQQAGSHSSYTFSQMLIFRLLEAPEIISRECLLASSMFASVYTMSLRSQSREILALRSCGVSIYRIIMPILIIGLLIAGASLFFEDYVVIPSFKLKDSYRAKIQGKAPKTYYRDRRDLIVFGGENVIYKIDLYRANTLTMHGVLLLKKNKKGTIIARIDSEKGKWDGTQWVFYNGTERHFNESGSLIAERPFKILYSGIKDNPKYFARTIRKIDDMTLREGIRYLTTIKRMGLPFKGAATKFHRKIARSFSLFLVIIIGASLGSMPFKNALVISFSVTLGMILVFFFLVEIGDTLGGSGKLPPYVGGWLGNIVFFLISVYLLKRMRI